MTDKSTEGFIEQVGIQVFAASMFSYFVSSTLDWISEHWTSKMYNILSWSLDFSAIRKILEVFGPVPLIILIDVGVFIFFIYHFWRKARKTPIKSVRDAFVQIFVMLPIASWPWAIFHLSVPHLGDNRLDMHICFFFVWIALCCTATVLYLLIWKPQAPSQNNRE